jgi:hypothetical protein
MGKSWTEGAPTAFKRKGRGRSDGGARLVDDGALTRHCGRLPRVVIRTLESRAAVALPVVMQQWTDARTVRGETGADRWANPSA